MSGLQGKMKEKSVNPKDLSMSKSAVSVDKVLLDEMLASACHFGHRVEKWNPKVRRFIYTKRDGIHIFDLTKTAECLHTALNFLKETAVSGKTILLVSTKLQATKLLAEAAAKSQCPYVTRKWMPGLLTNFDTIKKRIKYFKDLKTQKAAGEWDKYTKKERLELDRTLEKLEDAFSGVENMMRLPDVVFVLDGVRDELALREARKLKITTIGICDSNCNPDLFTYPIPGNDDAIKSLRFFITKIAEAISAGRSEVPEPKPQAEDKAKEEGVNQAALLS